MVGRLQDKVALVTGAGSVAPGWGNGKATAVVVAHRGAEVVAVNIELGASDEAKNTTGIHITLDGGVSLKCE